jgi:hypothetical protein
MGWIEEAGKELGHKSLRAVAVAMSSSPSWPKGAERSVETIANKVRHADAGKDVGWWLGKGKPFLAALADVLKEDVENLVERLQSGPSASGGEGAAVWTFKMFPALQPIDLRSEDPFPGVPSELVRAGRANVVGGAGRSWEDTRRHLP